MKTVLSLCRKRMIVHLLLLLMTLTFSGCTRSPEAKSARYIEAGKKLLQKNDAARAILQFRDAVQATPKNAEAFYQLSLAYFAVGDLRMGVAALRKALEVNPKHTAARLRMAQLMSMASDPALVKDAQQRLEKMLEEAPDDAYALHALAFTELKLGEPENAIQHLGHAMMLAPNDITIAVSMAEAKLQQRDVKGAEEILRKEVQNSPKSADAALVLGRFYSSQKEWSEAEQEFRQALSLDPNSGSALLDLANLQNSLGRKLEAEQTFKRLSGLRGGAFKSTHAVFLFQEGRRDEAIRELEALAKDAPDDRRVRTQLITAYRVTGRGADAEKLLDQVLKKNSKDADALLQRGEMLIASGQYNRAEIDLNQAFHMNPDSAAASYVFAKLHQGRGESLLYRQYLMKALQLDPTLLPVRLEAVQELLRSKDLGGAMGLLDEIPSGQKDMPAVLVQRNWVLWARGDMAEMRKGIDAGLSITRSSDLLLQDGIWKLRAGKFATARESLEQALDINPGDIRALGALNEAYVALKQGPVALEKVKEYASHNPKAAPVQEFLGVMLTASGDQLEARSAFEAAKAADPAFVRADLSLTQLDIVNGKLDDAQRRLKTLLTADKGNITARLWFANLEVMKGDKRSALEDFRQVVQADPNNAQALNNYAYLLSEGGDQSTEALKYAQRAKELSPTHAAYSDTLGWILYRRGLYPLAVSELERAAADGGDAVCNYHLAMAYAKMGNLDRGRKVLQAGLKQNPNLPEAKTAREMLGMAK